MDLQDEIPPVSPSDTESASPAPAEDNPAPQAGSGEEDKDLLAVVRDAVQKTPEAAASPAAAVETGAKPADAIKDPTAAEEDQDEENEDFSNVPFNQHPRFKQLVTQRRKLRDQVRQLEPDAERYRNVQRYLDINGLSAEDAHEALELRALMRANPAEAWKRLQPMVSQLLSEAGEILSDDLQQRVAAGEMTKQAALEVSRARAQVASVQRMHSISADFAAKQAVVSRQQAAAAWEQDRRLKDPNFGAKAAVLAWEVKNLLAQEGRPDTPEGVRDQLERAYAAVNRSFVAPAAAQPARQPVAPMRSGSVAGNAKPEPRNAMEAVRLALGQ